MIHRTLLEAQNEPQNGCSWIQRVILEVKLSSGITFYRTYDFDSSRHKCRACRRADWKRRKAGVNSNQGPRMACTGHVCQRCGNPFAGFTRRIRHRQPAANRYVIFQELGFYEGGLRLHGHAV